MRVERFGGPGVTEPERDPSIHSEPHLKKSSFAKDVSEEPATRKLEREKSRVDPAEERAVHSVFDEPISFPDRRATLIETDWCCRNCGYNLRGLTTGHPCPECGHVERYEPPREGEESYARWVEAYRSRVSDRQAWAAAVLLPLLGIPLAVVWSVMSVEWAGALSFIVIGPAVAEVLKLAVPAVVAERRAYVVKHASQIYLMAVIGAVLYAVTQNAVLLSIFYPDASLEFVALRWFGGMPAHVACTVIAARGLVAAQERADHEQRRANLADAYPLVLVAVVLHGAVNAGVFFSGHLGYGF